MARKRLFSVNQDAYEKALRREIMEIMVTQKHLMKARAMGFIEEMNFHKREILLENGTTSDYIRKKALINSITSERLQWELRGTKLSLKTSAMGKDFKNSHIGWYYELGTGTQYRPPRPGFKLPHPGDPNPYRPFGSGTVIVSRSKNDNGGKWKDMGGNIRRTNSRKGGKPLKGLETRSYRWFERAHDVTVNAICEKLKEVPKKVNITHFIEGRNITLK